MKIVENYEMKLIVLNSPGQMLSFDIPFETI